MAIEDPKLNAAMDFLLGEVLAMEEMLWNFAVMVHGAAGSYPVSV